jgi:hypothetical protein
MENQADSSIVNVIKGMINRAKQVISDPTGCWPKIREEQSSIEDVYRTFVVPGAALGPICFFIGFSVLFGFHGFFAGMYQMVLSYVAALAMVYIAAVVVQKTAEFFGGKAERVNTVKLIAYSSAPCYLASVLFIIPPLSVLILFAAAYSIYIYVQGAPQLADLPEDKKTTFLWGSIAALIATGVVIMLVMRILSCS